MSKTAKISEHLAATSRLITDIDHDEIGRVVVALDQSRRAGGRIFLVGNGGSAATATHFASDLLALGLAPRFDPTALADNTSVLTAIANDDAYQRVFAHQLEGRISPVDVLVVISCSGDSANLVSALQVATNHGATTVALLGTGGKCAANSTHVISVASTEPYLIEGVHSVIAHTITACLDPSRR